MSEPVKVQFYIPFRFPALNDLLRQKRQSNHVYNETKKSCEKTIAGIVNLMALPAFSRVRMHYKFFEENRKRDPSNIASAAIKFIEDALVNTGVLAGDGWLHIEGYTVQWDLAPGCPGIEVTIEGEVSDESRRDRQQQKTKKTLERALKKRANPKRDALMPKPTRKAPRRGSSRKGGKFPVRKLRG